MVPVFARGIRGFTAVAAVTLLTVGSARTLASQMPLLLVPVRASHVVTVSEQGQADRARLTPRQRLALGTVPPGARLVALPRDGSFVRLADGTVWEVYLPDRPVADAWRAGDYVTVTRAAAGAGDYDHLLVNAPAGTRVFARFVDVVPARRR